MTMSNSGQDAEKASKILKNGGLVAIPTETVYGLAANAYDPEAVARIFEVKKRPHFNPLIVHTHGLAEAQHFVKKIPDRAIKLAEAFWPGPLTLLLLKKNIIPDLVTSGMERVAVRVPNHPLTEKLLHSIDFPLVAPSANPFGYVSPTSADHVQQQLGKQIDYILDGGECHVGIESTIVGFDEDETTIYRLGGLEKEQIESCIGKVAVIQSSSSNPQSPGMLKSHYSPSTQVVTGNIEETIKMHTGKKIGIIRFKPSLQGYDVLADVSLSGTGDLREAAKNLFSALRKMDDSDVELIIAEIFPEEGLGLAINDRLKRASVRNLN